MESEMLKVLLEAIKAGGTEVFALGALAFAYFQTKERGKAKKERDEWQQKYIDGLEREKEVHRATREYLDKHQAELLEALQRKN